MSSLTVCFTVHNSRIIIGVNRSVSYISMLATEILQCTQGQIECMCQETSKHRASALLRNAAMLWNSTEGKLGFSFSFCTFNTCLTRLSQTLLIQRRKEGDWVIQYFPFSLGFVPSPEGGNYRINERFFSRCSDYCTQHHRRQINTDRKFPLKTTLFEPFYRRCESSSRFFFGFLSHFHFVWSLD